MLNTPLVWKETNVSQILMLYSMKKPKQNQIVLRYRKPLESSE